MERPGQVRLWLGYRNSSTLLLLRHYNDITVTLQNVIVNSQTPGSFFTLRTPPTLDTHIEHLSREQRRSVNGEIVQAFEEYCEQRVGSPRVAFQQTLGAETARPRFRTGHGKLEGGVVRRTIRLPQGLHVQLLELALDDHRSLNSEMVEALSWFIDRHQQ